MIAGRRRSRRRSAGADWCIGAPQVPGAVGVVAAWRSTTPSPRSAKSVAAEVRSQLESGSETKAGW